MVLMILLNIHMICKMFTKILKSIIDERITVIIVFDDMIADMISNKKLNSIVTELFVRGRKLNISLAFITQSYFKVPKMLDYTLPNKRRRQQIAINHSSDIDFKEFMKIYKKCTAKRYSFLVNNTT